MTLTPDKVLQTIQKKVKDVTAYALTSKTIRADISTNNVQLRKTKTLEIIALFPGAVATKERPNDILLPGKIMILVKPAKGAAKTASGAFYGLLEKIDLSVFDLSKFSEVSTTFAGGKLADKIKEASDILCVSSLNEEIMKALKGSTDGITLRLENYTFKNVIGCVPVTNGEPKADVVLVCRNGKQLYPDCYLSYKMGSTAKDFQNYSGLTVKASPFIFNHPETREFYLKLKALSDNNQKADIYQIIKDNKIIGNAVWGMDFGKGFGINNCHVIAQGNVSINGSTIKYTHTHKNGDFHFDKTYQPVFGARYATGRNNVGPSGIQAANFRIGIFPRAYRSAWLQD